MKHRYIFSLFVFLHLLFFNSVFSLSAEDKSRFVILLPEYSDANSLVISPADKKELLENLQNEIYKVFSHYSEGNAETDRDADKNSIKTAEIIKSVIRISGMIESDKGGFFCTAELVLSGKESDKGISMKYTAYGKTETEAFHKSVSRLPEQLKYRYSDFDEKTGFYRIIDIYQNEIIVSCGKNDGFSRGDYLEILDSRTGRAEGRIILTESDNNLSYGRLLYWKKNEISESSPTAGLKVRKINYIGLNPSVSAVYLVDDYYSGCGFNFKLEYFRSLYIFHPFISAAVYSIESSSNSYDMNVYSAGIAMLRHFGKISLSSEVSCEYGLYRNSDSSFPGFKGGRINTGIEYSLSKHLGIFTEAGFIHLFAEDDSDPDIGGFLFGGGLGFKY